EEGDWGIVRRAAEEMSGAGKPCNAISSLCLVAEKHGAFYHPARVEALTNLGKINLCANVAISQAGRSLAPVEYQTLLALHSNFAQHFTPRVLGAAGNPHDGPCLFLAQWFEGYCEYHLYDCKDNKPPRMRVWDMEQGPWFLNRDDAEKTVFREALILGYYYDPASFAQVFPWHLAAGDFVMHKGPKGPEIKLITARGRAALFESDDKDPQTVFLALLFFLVNLTLRLRLDRHDGTGQWLFYDETAVYRALKGCLAGLALREAETGEDFVAGAVNFLKSLSLDDLLEAGQALLDACNPEAPDLALLQQNLVAHSKALYKAITMPDKG
ncbi:MAG: hypothetical protein QMD09_14975, partial [Desulfatibacillaceae bacterium]|nr:hypothetical protein [Desulfatibacillaceae bacterium]